ncbi:MAG: ABC transporter ATP-binding protein [Candidatus Atribacteria bacterium]|nr:ABC transporter ATP-binding protein [Candidatus Atribacteria bacterium]
MEPILKVENLTTQFFTYAGVVQAVRGVSFEIFPGEAVGLVGESGCGKSVTGLSIMRLIPDPPGKIVSGAVYLDGKNLIELSEKEMRSIRGKEISMIFQDPMTSLNPVFTIGYQIVETLMLHQNMTKKQAEERAIELLNMVQIKSPERVINQYPHQLSGGMRQRVMAAIAIACEPKIIIADEPTTSLDVTIQAQILNLLADLKTELNSSIILITHNLAVVAGLCSRVIVMYAGIIVEEGTDTQIYDNPLHPYTWGLMKAVPKIHEEEKERLMTIPGLPPDLLSPPKGCPFALRCEYAMRICFEERPQFFEPEEGHKVACWLMDPRAPKVKRS